MATSCSSFATLTNTITTFTESLFTTVTETVSTPPGSVSQQTIATCIPVTVSNITTCTSSMITTEVTSPGTPTTITVPITRTSQIPITTLDTLYGSSCVTETTPPSTSPPPTSTPPPPPTPPPTPSPSPTTLTSLTTFTSDSSTFVSTVTTTSDVTPTLPISSPPPTSTGDSKAAAPVGAIVGGVVGGLVAFAFLGFLTWYLIRKQTGFDNFFNRDEGGSLGSSSPSKPQPADKPYNYKLVGENGSSPSGAGQDIGNLPSQQSAPGHARTSSMTPLLASTAGAAALSGGIAVAAASSRRPNDASQSLGGPTHPPGAVPPSNFPPGMQNWQAGQTPGAYGPVHGHAQGYPNINVNAMGYPPGPPSNVTSMYTGSSATPGTMNTSMLGHNTSVSSGSMYSGNTSPPPSQWGGSPPFGGPAMLPPMAGMSQQPHPQQQQFGQQQPQFGQPQQPQPFGQASQQFNPYPPQQHQQQPVFDPYVQPTQTSSSSASPEPARPLQVINADIPSGSLTAFETPGAGSSSAGGGAAGSSSNVNVDGKGRPINTKGEKAALVHLDGGMYQTPTPGQLPAGAAPPAYGES